MCPKTEQCVLSDTKLSALQKGNLCFFEHVFVLEGVKLKQTNVEGVRCIYRNNISSAGLNFPYS